jgi:hypothetical protein
MKVIQTLILMCAIALVFAVGYASHGLLGDWIANLVVQSPAEQFGLVFRATFGVLTGALAVASCVVMFAFVSFLTLAVLQEIYYQFFQRRVISLMMKEARSAKAPVREKSPREKAEELERTRRQKEYVEARKFARQFKAREDRNVQVTARGVDGDGKVEVHPSQGQATAQADDAGHSNESDEAAGQE